MDKESNDKIKSLLENRQFVENLINEKSWVSAKKLFEKNQVNVTDKDMQIIALAINKGIEIKEEALENVSGGVTMEGIKSASKNFLKGVAYGTEGVLAYPLEPLIGTVFSIMGNNKYEIGSGSKWFRQGAKHYFKKGANDIKTSKGEEYNTPWES